MSSLYFTDLVCDIWSGQLKFKGRQDEFKGQCDHQAKRYHSMLSPENAFENVICKLASIIFVWVSLNQALDGVSVFVNCKTTGWMFFKIWFYFVMLFAINVTFFFETSRLQLVSTVVTDALVLKHQGISRHSAEYRTIFFQMFMG